MSTLMMRNYRRDVPIAIMICLFIFFAIFSYFYYDPYVSGGALTFQTLVSFAGRWGLGLGVFSLIFVHARRIALKQKDWFYSAAMFLPFIGMVLTGFFAPGGRQDPIYRWWYTGFNVPVQYAVDQMQFFYWTWAYFRVVRARNWPTLIFTVVFMIFCFGYSPLGNYILPPAKAVTEAIATTFSVSVQRALALTGMGAGIAMGIRVLLGLEKGWLGALGRKLPTLPIQKKEGE